MIHSRKLDELIVHLGAGPDVVKLGLTKLWKLIYYIEAQAARELGASVTGSEFIKYQHGPVPSRGEKHLRQLVRGGSVKTAPRKVGSMVLNEVRSERKTDLAVFAVDEREIIDAVCEKLGRKSAVALSELSHKEPAWHYAGMMEKLSPELIAYGCEEDADGL